MSMQKSSGQVGSEDYTAGLWHDLGKNIGDFQTCNLSNVIPRLNQEVLGSGVVFPTRDSHGAKFAGYMPVLAPVI